MNRITILSGLLFAAILSANASATIINIPADYATIQAGIDASTDGDTVLVQPGMYIENINFNRHDIVLGSLFLTTEDVAYIASTIIDGDSSGTVVSITGCYNATLTGFTIQNGLGGGIYSCGGATIRNNIVRDNVSYSDGAGIYSKFGAEISNNEIYNNQGIGQPVRAGGIYTSENSDAIIQNNNIWGNSYSGISCNDSYIYIYNNLIDNNMGRGLDISDDCFGDVAYNTISNNSSGGVIFGLDASAEISFNNNLVYGNSTERSGGGVYLLFGTVEFNNNIIYGNYAEIGGGIYIHDNLQTITNSIVWDNQALDDGDQIYLWIGNCPIQYCDVQGGWPGEGNIDIDPLFRDPENGDFHLMAIDCGDPYDSPCIDVGHPGIIDTILNCDWGLGAARSDMGAYSGGEDAVDIDEPIVSIPQKTSLFQNYPNPFNASTMIKYELPQQSQVIIEIYDILGRKVITLMDKQQAAGYHQAIWHADDFSSGMYFYKLTAGEYEFFKKMILIK